MGQFTPSTTMRTFLLISSLALAAPDHRGRSGQKDCDLERRLVGGQDCFLEPECDTKCSPGAPVSSLDPIP